MIREEGAFLFGISFSGPFTFFRIETEQVCEYKQKLLCTTLSCGETIKWKWTLVSHVRFFATPWTAQSMEFSRSEYWGG